MTPGLTEAGLEPFATGGYAWRWRGPKYDVLPADVLQSIRALRRDRAHQVFRPSLLIDDGSAIALRAKSRPMHMTTNSFQNGCANAAPTPT
jgi:hypothetical protein